jgi:hypothetical protein
MINLFDETVMRHKNRVEEKVDVREGWMQIFAFK